MTDNRGNEGISRRYRMAIADNQVQAIMREDAELLGCFGLRLMSLHGGLQVSKKLDGPIHVWDTSGIDFGLWDMLRPLLVELRERRNPHASAGEAK